MADDGDAFDSIFGNEKEERPEPANWQRPAETGGRKVHLTVTPLQRQNATITPLQRQNATIFMNLNNRALYG